MGIRLRPIANEVLAAWPEYKYATRKAVSEDDKGKSKSAYRED